MRRFKEGAEEAFEEIFDRYSAHIINFLFRFLNSQEELEDIAQEVLLRIYKNKERYDPGRPFRPWIFSIAARLASNHLRHGRRHPQNSLDGASDDVNGANPLSQLPDQTLREPEKTLEKKLLVRSVQEALSKLPENQRIAVLLARFEDMSHEEIAQTLGVSLSSVKSLLFRAKESLKKSLRNFALS